MIVTCNICNQPINHMGPSHKCGHRDMQNMIAELTAKGAELEDLCKVCGISTNPPIPNQGYAELAAKAADLEAVNKWLCDQLAQSHAKWHDKGNPEYWQAEARKEQSDD